MVWEVSYRHWSSVLYISKLIVYLTFNLVPWCFCCMDLHRTLIILARVARGKYSYSINIFIGYYACMSWLFNKVIWRGWHDTTQVHVRNVWIWKTTVASDGDHMQKITLSQVLWPTAILLTSRAGCLSSSELFNISVNAAPDLHNFHPILWHVYLGIRTAESASCHITFVTVQLRLIMNLRPNDQESDIEGLAYLDFAVINVFFMERQGAPRIMLWPRGCYQIAWR